MTDKTLIEGPDSLRALVGRTLGHSEWKTLTDEDIARFAEATGDFQWIHVDRERCARESPFKVPVAHGYFALSRIGGLFFELVEVKGFASVLNYGANKVRFVAPIKSGARYRLVLELKDLKEAPTSISGQFSATIEIEGETRPACVAEVIYYFMLGSQH